MGSALNFAEMKLIFLVLVTLVVTVPEATGTPHLLYDLCNRLVAHCHTNSCSGRASGSAHPIIWLSKKGSSCQGALQKTCSRSRKLQHIWIELIHFSRRNLNAPNLTL